MSEAPGPAAPAEAPFRVLHVGPGHPDRAFRAFAPTGAPSPAAPATIVAFARATDPALAAAQGPFDAVVVTDRLTAVEDLIPLFEHLASVLAPGGWLALAHAFRPLDILALLGGHLAPTWVPPDKNALDLGVLRTVLEVSGLRVVDDDRRSLVERAAPALDRTRVLWARPDDDRPRGPGPSVSVICPCKDERGNVRAVVDRVPLMGPRTEIVFVDGGSTDGTYEVLLEMVRDYDGPLDLRLLRQEGTGKGHAVVQGFRAARNDVLMVLDTDLTVPPEELPRFHRALALGLGDFVNGVRFVYPMGGEAMRPLNWIGNKFFSTALSWALAADLRDTLCGTKALRREDWLRLAAAPSFYGLEDPYGDFELLFGAARLGLRILDLPVRYGSRTYGATKISRFHGGFELLLLTAAGTARLRRGA